MVQEMSSKLVTAWVLRDKDCVHSMQIRGITLERGSYHSESGQGVGGTVDEGRLAPP